VVRFDADSTRAIIDNKGNRTTPKEWVQKLKLTYRPGIVLFNEGNEITRIDGFLYPFHFKEALRYVGGDFYKRIATYSDYLAYRQTQLLEQGIDINIQ
jgi:thioredoxin-related protein